MSCDPGYETSLISELKSLENVKEAHGTLGLYDIIAKLEADSDEKIKQTITEKIRKMDKIGSTMTLMKVEGEELFKVDTEKLTGSILGKNAAQAYIVIYCEPGKEYLVLRDFKEIPEIKEADVVYGNYSILGKIETENHKELEKIITKKIRKLNFIRTTMTLNVIKEQE